MQLDNIPEVASRQIAHIAEVCERIKPLVVIRCITYNHEAFLKDALDGFLMQKTDFPFVAVVHDDASTDGTVAILREYAERYPDIILPIFEEENQYSKRDGTITRVMNIAKLATGAKYVAMCEGDDYWTYEYKLQKQVDFLETHPDYSLVFHNAKTLRMDGASGTLGQSIYHQDKSREYTAKEIYCQWTIPTASALYRIEIDTDPIQYNTKFKVGDNVKFLTAAKHGKLYGIFEDWSVYRLHKGGVTVASGHGAFAKTLIEHSKVIEEVFASLLGKDVCREVIVNHYLSILKIDRNNKRYKEYCIYFIKAVKDCGFTIVKHEWMHFVEITGKYKKWR